MEEWTPIEDFPGYFVSALGQVKGPKGKILKLCLTKRGYLEASLYCNRKLYRRYIHSLVSEAFNGPQPMGYDVHHKDSNKLNNKPDNLEYIKRCLHMNGTLNPQCKLTENQVKEMRNLYKSGIGYDRLSNKFDISKRQVARIIKYQKWTSV